MRVPFVKLRGLCGSSYRSAAAKLLKAGDAVVLQVEREDELMYASFELE